MAKGKYTMVDGAFDQDYNLKDDYYTLFANNVDLEGEKDEVDLDGVAELAGAEIDGGDFDGADLGGYDLDGVKRDGVNIYVSIILILMITNKIKND